MKRKVLINRAIAIICGILFFWLGSAVFSGHRNQLLATCGVVWIITISIHSVSYFVNKGVSFILKKRFTLSKEMLKIAFGSNHEPSSNLIAAIPLLFVGIISNISAHEIPEFEIYISVVLAGWFVILSGMTLYLFEDLPEDKTISDPTSIKCTTDEPHFYDDESVYPHKISTAFLEFANAAFYPFILCLDACIVYPFTTMKEIARDTYTIFDHKD